MANHAPMRSESAYAAGRNFAHCAKLPGSCGTRWRIGWERRGRNGGMGELAGAREVLGGMLCHIADQIGREREQA